MASRGMHDNECGSSRQDSVGRASVIWATGPACALIESKRVRYAAAKYATMWSKRRRGSKDRCPALAQIARRQAKSMLDDPMELGQGINAAWSRTREGGYGTGEQSADSIDDIWQIIPQPARHRLEVRHGRDHALARLGK